MVRIQPVGPDKRSMAPLLRGDLPTALVELEAAVRADPLNAAALRNLACLLDVAGRHDEALLLYHKAIGLAPDDAMAHSNLGLVYVRQGSIDKAKTAFQTAVAA